MPAMVPGSQLGAYIFHKIKIHVINTRPGVMPEHRLAAHSFINGNAAPLLEWEFSKAAAIGGARLILPGWQFPAYAKLLFHPCTQQIREER